MKIILLIVSISLLISPESLLAQTCKYKGTNVPVGTTRGNCTCTRSGWQCN